MNQAISLRFLNMQAFFEAFRIRYFTILVEVFKNIILVENTYLTSYTEWAKHKIISLNL